MNCLTAVLAICQNRSSSQTRQFTEGIRKFEVLVIRKPFGILQITCTMFKFKKKELTNNSYGNRLYTNFYCGTYEVGEDRGWGGGLDRRLSSISQRWGSSTSSLWSWNFPKEFSLKCRLHYSEKKKKDALQVVSCHLGLST